MAITSEMVKSLREKTGAGVLDCKRALDKCLGDMDKAIALLREQGLAVAAKKATRVAKDGLIEAYVHPGAKVASLVELDCETDFVARTPDFKNLAHDLAMQVAATNPLYVSAEDVPAAVIEAKKDVWRTELADQNKPPQVVESIIQGKLSKFYEQACLMQQPFIKDESVKVGDLVTQLIAKIGENIVVRRFARFAIGEETPEE